MRRLRRDGELDIADIVLPDEIARAHELVERPVKAGGVVVAIT
jgi:hypothetical protein